nr:Hsp20/alpha crystallin family protein [Bacillus sp. B15-48]
MKSLFPICDIYEKGNHLFVEAELPGMSKQDISVSLKGQDLIIAGKYSTLKPGLHYYLKERENRHFEKKIILPVKINKTGIRSSLEDGLLTIELPIIREEDSVPIYIDLSSSTPPSPLQP